MDIIGIKPAPGGHKPNFKKVVTIPCRCDTNGTFENMDFHEIEEK